MTAPEACERRRERRGHHGAGPSLKGGPMVGGGDSWSDSPRSLSAMAAREA